MIIHAVSPFMIEHSSNFTGVSASATLTIKIYRSAVEGVTCILDVHVGLQWAWIISLQPLIVWQPTTRFFKYLIYFIHS